ncbi:MAG: acyl carrier protein [Ilumatobacteraceae bacterium]
MDIKERVRDFIATNFYLPDSIVLTDDTSFLDTGVIDSTSVLELTGFLEEEFDIEIDDDELVPENLDSLRNVEAFITGKIGA